MTAPQRSPEWFAARTKRITASRVGAILGHSPYATHDDAMRTMVREALGAESEFTGNTATQWGTAMEAHAIADFEMDNGLTVEATGFHRFEDWAGASPDGLIGVEAGLEMKCPYGIRNEGKPTFKTLVDQPHYHDQVQFSMICLDRPRWFFAQWTPYGCTQELVHRSQEWADINMPILRQFYARFLSELKNPEEHLAPLRVTIDTPTATLMANEWDKLTEAIANAEDRKKDLLAEMVALAGERNAVFGGRKLTQTTRSGVVSYAKALKELAPRADLSKWTGKPSSYWGLK
jgi:putative phage-type endonuclease